MKPFTTHTGLVCAMDRSHVDTDQIIPKQFLKRIERTGYEEFLFYDWRFDERGQERPDFELNAEGMDQASILLTRRNFGCGSSREHAVWGLENYGFRVVLAPTFADIFFNNCFKNGVLPIALGEERIEQLFQAAGAHPGYQLTVDLERRTITDAYGLELAFQVDDFRRQNLLDGLDDIALTLQHEDKIAAYEAAHGIG